MFCAVLAALVYRLLLVVDEGRDVIYTGEVVEIVSSIFFRSFVALSSVLIKFLFDPLYSFLLILVHLLGVLKPFTMRLIVFL